YEADFPCGAPQRLKRLRKKSRCGPQRPSAAKAGIQNNVVIAALKRCATQNREQDRVFQQPARRPFLFAEFASAGFILGEKAPLLRAGLGQPRRLSLRGSCWFQQKSPP